ncbi:MAG: ABC transporter substrate-binding protein [Pseudomonadota bacterium]|nr:ABC transporter substrate-binding protein [Pseudomonadota bacterium]
MLRWLMGCILGAVLLTACDDPEPIAIGFVGGLSGRSADISRESLNALDMAVAEVNAAGGLNGRKLDLLVRDNQGDPALAADQVRDLKNAGAVAIIGPNVSAIAQGMLPVIIETDLVTLSPTVSSLAFAGLDDPFFRMNSTTRQNAGAYATHLYETGLRRISAAFDLQNKVFSESWLYEFRGAFERLGGEILSAEGFDSGATEEYGPLVSRLLATKPESLLLIANGVDTAQLSLHIRGMNRSVGIVAVEWAASEQLIELGGAAVEGITILQTYDRDDLSPRYVAFREAYQARFETSPGFASIAAYDASIVLFAALRAQKDGESLKHVLLSQGPLDGLQQELSFDAFGDGTRRQFFVTVRDGKLVPR